MRPLFPNIIVAVYSDWGIGFRGRQPVVIAEDRRFFREATEGGAVIAGRKTFESIGGALPGRMNIVLTRNRAFAADGATAAHSISDALRKLSCSDPAKLFIIGGSSVYRAFLPLCGCAYVTKIEAAPLSDAFFPDLDAMNGWELAYQSEPKESENVRYTFNTYRKKSQA